MPTTFDLRNFFKYQESAWALIAANTLPLAGVLLFGWDAFSIVALYWVENVIIGAINVLKMITCSPNVRELTDDLTKQSDPAHAAQIDAMLKELRSGHWDNAHFATKLFLVPFFVVHYGLFCFVHGFFVFLFFGREDGFIGHHDGFERVLELFSEQHLWWGVVGLVASHLWSFFVNYLGRGEYRRTLVPVLMMQPYARVVVLHLAILLGGFVSVFLENNVVVLTLLVIGKTVLDLSFHLRERERNAGWPQIPTVLSEVPIEKRSPEIPRSAAPARSHPQDRASLDD
jgi:hypothetical protein